MELFPPLTPDETADRLAKVNDKLQWLLLVEHKDHCKIDIDCREEDQPIEGNAIASGDDLEDLKYHKAIVQQLRRGNSWAWCIAVVTVTDPELEGFAVAETLGSCCYRDREDFILGGYLEQMVGDAIKGLTEQRENIRRIFKQRDDKILELKKENGKSETFKEKLDKLRKKQKAMKQVIQENADELKKLKE